MEVFRFELIVLFPGTAAALRSVGRFDDPPFVDALGVGAVLGELDGDFAAVDDPAVKAVDGLLSLVGVLVADEGEAPGVAGATVLGDEDVDDLAVLVEEREEVVGGCTEGDVEHQQGVGVADVWGT